MSTQLDPAAEESDGGDVDEEELLTRVETLEDENERLRQELSAARRTSYRRTAIGMALLGGVAILGAGLFPELRVVMLALGGTGMFGALLTYYLTPERFVAASVGERVYSTFATNVESIAGELELSDSEVYVPVSGDPAVRLFLPEQPLEGRDIPSQDTLRNAFVIESGYRGLSLHPSGDELRKELRQVADPLPESPEPLVRTTCEALIEQFELAEVADPDVDPGGRVTVEIEGSAYGPVDRLDHPVASFIATTLAGGLDQAVNLKVATTEDESRYLVDCRWEPSEPESE